MGNFTEIDIIIQLQNNNFENFKFIYDKYYIRIFNLVIKRVHDYYLAEDIVQEIFIEVILNVYKLKKAEAFYKWLLKITINKINYNLKKLINEKSYQVLVSEFNIDNQKTLNKNLEVEYTIKLFIKILDNKINSLPKNKKKIIIQYFYKNMSIKEIAQLENIPIGTVKSTLYYSKKELKNYLNSFLVLFI